MSSVWADCRHALRLYRLTPYSSLIVMLVLAVAIAACAAILSLYMDLVRPHPGFERADRLATLVQSDGGGDRGIPYAALERMTREITSIEAAASVWFQSTLNGPEREPAVAALVSGQFFGGLRPRLVLGTGFGVEDHLPEALPVVVLSYRYWQQRLGARPDVLGTTIEIARNPGNRYIGPDPIFSTVEPEVDAAQFRIVGILAESAAEFGGPEPAVWLPVERAWPLFVGIPEQLQAALQDTYVRLRDGASVTDLVNELDARLLGADPILRLQPGEKPVAMEGIVNNVTTGREARRQLKLFLGAGVLLLLVAAANVSLFLLARAPGRRRELGIRMAVGAPVSRLARQLASEAGLMVVVAAVPGLLGSLWLSLFLAGLPALRETDWSSATLLDWRVAGLIGAFLLTVILLVSLAPVLDLKESRITAMSRHVTARPSIAQRMAGAVQIIAAGTCGATAIAFAWYLGSLMFGNPGFELDNRYVVDGRRIFFNAPGLDRAGALVELDRRREILRSIPGVSAVAFGDPVPGEELGRRSPTALQLDSGTRVDFSWGSLNSDFAELLGVDVIYGRLPETAGSDGVVINQTLARLVWGRDDVVGETLPVEGGEIIGVVEDISYYHPAAAAPPFAFRSLALFTNLWAVIEMEMTPAQFTRELDRLVAEGALEDSDSRIRSLRDMRYEAIESDRARGIVTIATATVAVVLSGFGFYGTQRYLVAAGRREYAIRACLGAGPRALGRLVHWRGLLLGLPGLVLAAFPAFIVVEMLRDGLISRTVTSGVVAFAVVAGLVLITFAASIGPANAARKVQPAALLRQDDY